MRLALREAPQETFAPMSEMFTLATRPRHQWGARHTTSAAESSDGHERSWKQCATCGLKRITVTTSTDPRRYQWPDGIEFERDCEPVCRAEAITEAKAS